MYLYPHPGDWAQYDMTPTMTPKRVHFAESNIVYSAPPTPSPTFSELSLPSSPDPPTPSLGKPDPLPPTADCSPTCTEQVEIDSILRADLIPPLQHDLNNHPSYITTSSLPRRPLSPSDLAQPATIPLRPFIYLIAHKFPWTLTIAASNQHYVTVMDVLATLHRMLRLPVTPVEFETLPSHEDMLRVSQAYEDRYKAITEPGAQLLEERKGVKRVDFLLGRKFLGLSRTTIGEDFWLVNVE